MTTANELKDLLKIFNKGIQTVIQHRKQFTIHVTNKKSAAGVAVDFIRTNQFEVEWAGNPYGGYDVFATVK